MSRKDSLGVEVEVGDIVFSAPRHKWAGKPEVGKVTRVSDTGRVTIKVPAERNIYAYERGAPKIEKESFRWEIDHDAEPDSWGGKPYKQVPYTRMERDYTVVGSEKYWLRKQAADITLIVLRKDGEDKTRDLSEVTGYGALLEALNLDYETEVPS